MDFLASLSTVLSHYFQLPYKLRKGRIYKILNVYLKTYNAQISNETDNLKSKVMFYWLGNKRYYFDMILNINLII